jgi:hypothetical protein
MSENTDNSIEKRLQDYAKQRREAMGEPLELHEATRAMLQAEVQSVYGKSAETTEKQPENEGFPTWLGWAVVGATVGLLAIAINLIPQKTAENSDFAKITPNTPEMAKVSVDPMTEDTIGEKQSQSQEGVGQARSEGKGNVAEAVSPARLAAPHIAATPGFSGLVQAQPRVAAFTANDKSAYFDNQRAMRQNFARMRKAPTKKSAMPAPVLASFQIEREGNEVRVVDQDGSVYTGTVINEEEFAEAESKQEESAQKLPVEAPGGGVNIAGAPPRPTVAPVRLQPGVATVAIRAVPRGRFYFRASGTNRTLGKPVVVEATLDNPPLQAKKFLAATQAKTAATVQQAVKPTENGDGDGSDLKNKKVDAPNIQAIRAIARMRVLGNARIDKANYPLDATILQEMPAKANTAGEQKK